MIWVRPRIRVDNYDDDNNDRDMYTFLWRHAPPCVLGAYPGYPLISVMDRVRILVRVAVGAMVRDLVMVRVKQG